VGDRHLKFHETWDNLRTTAKASCWISIWRTAAQTVLLDREAWCEVMF